MNTELHVSLRDDDRVTTHLFRVQDPRKTWVADTESEMGIDCTECHSVLPWQSRRSVFLRCRCNPKDRRYLTLIKSTKAAEPAPGKPVADQPAAKPDQPVKKPTTTKSKTATPAPAQKLGQQVFSKPEFELPPDAEIAVHPYAESYPISAEQYEQIAHSIEKNGQLIAGVLTKDHKTLLEGRQRRKICRDLGRAFRYTLYDGEETEEAIIEFIEGANDARRQLSLDAQAARKTLYFAAQYNLEAKQAKLQGAAKGGKNKSGENSPPASPRTSKRVWERLRDERDVSEYRAKIAVKLYNNEPDLLRQVQEDKMSLREAEKEMKKRNKVPKQKAKTPQIPKPSGLDQADWDRIIEHVSETTLPFVETFEADLQKEVAQTISNALANVADGKDPFDSPGDEPAQENGEEENNDE